MIPFTPIALEDRDWMQPIFDHAQLPSEESVSYTHLFSFNFWTIPLNMLFVPFSAVSKKVSGVFTRCFYVKIV